MRAAFLLPLVAVVALAGCGGGGGAVDPKVLPELVLQRGDLRGYERFDEGPQASLDRRGLRADPGRFGREGGWKARFRRPGDARTQGPLVVESFVDGFRSDGGAERDFEAYRLTFEHDAPLVPGGRLLRAPGLGESSVAMTSTQAAFPRDVRFYRVAWRYANVTASVVVSGFAGKVSLADAVRLAREQQRRLESATG